MSGSTSQIRLLLVEDVPQVAQYVRGLLNAQQSIKLVDVVTDGGRVAAQVQQLRPDVIVVDWLLQGRTKGHRDVETALAEDLDDPVTLRAPLEQPVADDDVGAQLLDLGRHPAAVRHDVHELDRLLGVEQAADVLGDLWHILDQEQADLARRTRHRRRRYQTQPASPGLRARMTSRSSCGPSGSRS